MSMITATAWVPRGFAAPFPTKYTFDEKEFKRISDLAKLQLDDAKEDLRNAHHGDKAQKSDDAAAMEIDGWASDDEDDNKAAQSKADQDDDDDVKEYDLEHYDSEGEDESKGEGMGMFGKIKSLAYHNSNTEDPYITMQDNEDEDEEREELQILATDNMVLAAKIEDEVAHLEVYVYEDEADNLYVHHDIMLPAIPLCVEWLDLHVGKGNAEKDTRANFVAVGTMDPDIEIWDLDTVDCMYPNAILGRGGDESNGHLQQDGKRRRKKANDDVHVDAVLSLAANRQHRNLLASASADKTVKLWDLHSTKCAQSYSYHTDRVCSVAWHPKESTILLSGSYDRTVVAADMRAPEAKAPRWGVESDVEVVKWDPHSLYTFFVSTEDGVVHYHDVRKAPADPSATKAIWTLQAHDECVSAFDINPNVPGLIATGSADKTVKLWNVQDSGPTMVVSRNLDVGKVFSTSWAPDAEVGFRLSVAGSKGTMQIWDTSTNAAVRKAFSNRLAPAEGEVQERLVALEEDSDDDEEEEEG